MPYIKTERRKELMFNFPDHVHPDNVVQTVGELNFMLTQVIKGYMANHRVSYQTINDIVGALEGAKLEFYRRVAAPYENDKIEQNGDVY